MISVGIDVAESAKGLDLVALDAGRRVQHSAGRLTVNDSVKLIRQIHPQIVCIDSPSG